MQKSQLQVAGVRHLVENQKRITGENHDTNRRDSIELTGIRRF